MLIHTYLKAVNKETGEELTILIDKENPETYMESNINNNNINNNMYRAMNAYDAAMFYFYDKINKER